MGADQALNLRDLSRTLLARHLVLEPFAAVGAPATATSNADAEALIVATDGGGDLAAA